MKAILEFNLPEEISAYKAAVDGLSWKGACEELDQWLRSNDKHGKTVYEMVGCKGSFSEHFRRPRAKFIRLKTRFAIMKGKKIARTRNARKICNS